MKDNIKKIRTRAMIFIVGLFVSGLTAIPLVSELEITTTLLKMNFIEIPWLTTIYTALVNIDRTMPFIFYGTDWLAFAHFLFALLFWGVYKDPVKNEWVTEFGLIACILIIPFAFIAGWMREIPIYWRLIDCSFGVIGLIVLAPIKKLTFQLKHKI